VKRHVSRGGFLTRFEEGDCTLLLPSATVCRSSYRYNV